MSQHCLPCIDMHALHFTGKHPNDATNEDNMYAD